MYGYILGKATALGCAVHAIGLMPDHVHLVVSVPPRVAIADCAQRLKGSSAHSANGLSSGEGTRFAWQRGYGVFSLGSRQLDATVDYVRQQKLHHEQGNTTPALERDSHEDEGPAAWHNGEGLVGITPVLGESAGGHDAQ